MGIEKYVPYVIKPLELKSFFLGYVYFFFLFAGLVTDGATRFASGLAAGLAFPASGFVVFT
jgi:hypothetical protein